MTPTAEKKHGPAFHAVLVLFTIFAILVIAKGGGLYLACPAEGPCGSYES